MTHPIILLIPLLFTLLAYRPLHAAYRTRTPAIIGALTPLSAILAIHLTLWCANTYRRLEETPPDSWQDINRLMEYAHLTLTATLTAWMLTIGGLTALAYGLWLWVRDARLR